MTGLEGVLQMPVVPDTKTGLPISAEHHNKINSMTLPTATLGQGNLERTPQQDTTAFTSDKGEKVTFGEGAKLVTKGFFGKIANMFKSIVKHPVKTLSAVALTTIGLAALPLIGISAATGAGILALGFAAIAVVKTGKDIIKAVKHKREGDNNALRQDLKNVGGDGVELALSLPFAPKAIRIAKNQLKYGPTIGLNKELISELGKTNGIVNKLKALKNANLQLAEEINFKVAIDKIKVSPEIKAKYFQLRNLKGEEFAKASYEQLVKDIGYEGAAPKMIIDDTLNGNTRGNYNFATGELRISVKAIKEMPQSKILNFQRHELEHFRQYSDIARTEGLGLDALAKAQAKAYIEKLRTGKTDVFDTNSMMIGDPSKVPPEKWIQWEADMYAQHIKQLESVGIYKDVIKSKGIIKAGTPEALQAEKYIEATTKYPDMTLSFIAPPEGYRENLLEVEAWKVGDDIGSQYGKCEAVQNLVPIVAKMGTIEAPIITGIRTIATITGSDKKKKEV